MTPANSSRVICITGAAGGLGRELVQTFLAQGDTVVAGVRGQHTFKAEDRLWIIPLEVTQTAQVETAFAAIQERLGRLDVLINNAGVTRDRLITQLTDEEWDEVMNVNLRGAYLCSRAALPALTACTAGHIINIASFAARKGHAGQSNYVAAKAGLLGFTQSLAKELGSQGVQVNAVLPGVLHTRMTAHLSPARLAALAAENVLGKLNDTGEVARFIWFLTTLKNVSGQIFQLDSRISRWT